MTAVERAPSEGPIEDIGRLAGLAFGFPVADSTRWYDEKIGRENLRVIREAGTAVGALGRIPMGLFVGGNPVPQVGIAGVAVAPEARGRGIARTLMAEAVRELHDEGVPISTLYSALHGLYRGVGYEDAGLLCDAAIPAGMIESADRGAGWREAADDDTARIHDCYNAFARTTSGMLDRGPYVWDRVYNPRGDAATGFIATADDGTAEAYVFLKAERFDARESGTGTAAGQRIWISDHAWSTPRGLQRLLGFLRGYSSVAGEIGLCIHPASPLLAALPDRRIGFKVRDRWMLRVISVPRALEARGYPAGLKATIDLDIADPIINANTGRWRLTIEDGRGTCEPGGDGGVTAGVRALASMYTGHASASMLANAGLIDGETGALALADAAFGTGPCPAMHDMF